MTTRFALGVILALSCLSGCSSRLAPVKPPRIDTAAAAAGAMAAFDADGDGKIVQAEACQGIRDQWQRYDQDGDESVSETELEARFEKWTSDDTGLMNLRAEVTYRGRPLPDAAVRLTPYEFLGPNVLPADGTTDPYGFVFLSIPKERLPKSQQATHGMQVGLYKISVTHPREQLADKYNTQTELSVDLSPNEGNTGIRLPLR